jgi:hypothetical protein
MPSQICPIHHAPKHRILEYLGARGIDAEVAEWKYFDAAFNRDRCRGLVWLRDGQPRAFLGFIPCSVTDGGTSWPMTWTCDWSVADRSLDAGLGVLLLKKAIAVTPDLLAFGGNDTTRALLPKVAAVTIDGAGLTTACPCAWARSRGDWSAACRCWRSAGLPTTSTGSPSVASLVTPTRCHARRGSLRPWTR